MNRFLNWALLALFVIAACHTVARGQEGKTFLCMDAGLIVDMKGDTCKGRIIPIEKSVEATTIKHADGTWTLGPASSRLTRKNTRKIFHEDFEYENGRLLILKPVNIVYAAGSLDVGSSEFRVIDKWVGGGYMSDALARYNPDFKPAPQADAGIPASGICGLNLTGPNEISRHTELIQVTCPPWEALAKLGLPTAGKGPQTQVLVHAREGRTVVVEVDGYEESGVLRKLSWIPGMKGAMVVFEGDQFKTLKVSVQEDKP